MHVTAKGMAELCFQNGGVKSKSWKIRGKITIEMTERDIITNVLKKLSWNACVLWTFSMVANTREGATKQDSQTKKEIETKVAKISIRDNRCIDNYVRHCQWSLRRWLRHGKIGPDPAIAYNPRQSNGLPWLYVGTTGEATHGWLYIQEASACPLH